MHDSSSTVVLHEDIDVRASVLSIMARARVLGIATIRRRGDARTADDDRRGRRRARPRGDRLHGGRPRDGSALAVAPGLGGIARTRDVFVTTGEPSIVIGPRS